MKLRSLSLLIAAILIAPIFAPPATALVNERDSKVWGHIFAGQTNVKTFNSTSTNAPSAKLEAKSKFEVTYNNFPDWARTDIQAAVDVWAANFQSSVPIKVEATWGRSAVYGLLGSARPGNYFNNFINSPDPTLWYPSALANAMAGRDLDKNNPEVVIQVNSLAAWDTRNDGKPSGSEFDLQSVFIHEIGHGLGFLSTDSYDNFFGFGSIEQPTPFDAYLQLDDGRRLSDLPSPSIELGKALTNNLVWSGSKGVAANNGVKPKMYTPSRYENGSSVSHLDEATFGKSGANAVMTPNLDAGEIIRDPGPLMLAMMEDMRIKPPAGIAVGIPAQVRNVQTLVGDRNVIITFDPPVNVRSSQVSGYSIKNNKTGAITYAGASPVVVKNLKNGTSYTFSITATNSNGTSDPFITSAVTPVNTWPVTTIDTSSDAKYLATATLNGQPFIAYISSRTKTLRVATYNGSVWKKTVVDGMGGAAGRTTHKLGGHISLCSTGTGTRQVIHLFYGDLEDKDLRHATIQNDRYSFEVVDGNGPTVQPYDQVNRVRTGSEVSYSSTCVATATTLQVFYRDESQGVLLGAVKKLSKWSYEIIDGDRKSDGRTTGDVAFHLKAIQNGSTTYLIYDSVSVVNTKKEATSGEVRLAERNTLVPNTWSYTSIDSPGTGASVLGYDVALIRYGSKVYAAWLAATGASLPNPSQIRFATLGNDSTSISTSQFGAPNGNLTFDGTFLAGTCQKRLCSIDTTSNKVSLVNGWQSDDLIQSGWIRISGQRYLVAGINGQLVAMKSI